jgi:hypothetical protein
VKLLPVIAPVEVIVHVSADTMFEGVLVAVHAPASPVLKPLPVMVTAVETGPEVGTRVI